MMWKRGRGGGVGGGCDRYMGWRGRRRCLWRCRRSAGTAFRFCPLLALGCTVLVEVHGPKCLGYSCCNDWRWWERRRGWRRWGQSTVMTRFISAYWRYRASLCWVCAPYMARNIQSLRKGWCRLFGGWVRGEWWGGRRHAVGWRAVRVWIVSWVRAVGVITVSVSVPVSISVPVSVPISIPVPVPVMAASSAAAAAMVVMRVVVVTVSVVAVFTRSGAQAVSSVPPFFPAIRVVMGMVGMILRRRVHVLLVMVRQPSRANTSRTVAPPRFSVTFPVSVWHKGLVILIGERRWGHGGVVCDVWPGTYKVGVWGEAWWLTGTVWWSWRVHGTTSVIHWRFLCIFRVARHFVSSNCRWDCRRWGGGR